MWIRCRNLAILYKILVHIFTFLMVSTFTSKMVKKIILQQKNSHLTYFGSSLLPFHSRNHPYPASCEKAKSSSIQNRFQELTENIPKLFHFEAWSEIVEAKVLYSIFFPSLFLWILIYPPFLSFLQGKAQLFLHYTRLEFGSHFFKVTINTKQDKLISFQEFKANSNKLSFTSITCP